MNDSTGSSALWPTSTDSSSTGTGWSSTASAETANGATSRPSVHDRTDHRRLRRLRGGTPLLPFALRPPPGAELPRLRDGDERGRDGRPPPGGDDPVGALRPRL